MFEQVASLVRMQVNSSSLYGRCYLTGEVVNIEDVSKVKRKGELENNCG